MRKWMVGLAFALLATANYAQSDRTAFATPVTLRAELGGTVLEWSAVTDEDLDYFAVVRALPAGEAIVAVLEPQGVVTDQQHAYRYVDRGDFTPGTGFHVRAVYRDGAYTDTPLLAAGGGGDPSVGVSSARDQRSVAQLRIDLESAFDRGIAVRIRTLGGTLLETYERQLTTGANELVIDYQGWPCGFYTVELGATAGDDVPPLSWLIHADEAG